MNDKPVRLEVTEAEQGVVFAGPATYVNKFYVSVLGGVIRIAFAEHDQLTGVPAFRTGVAMQVQDAMALRDLLADMLQPYDEALRSAEVGGA